MSLAKKIIAFLRKPFHDKFNALHVVFNRLKGAVYYRHIFGSFGSGSILFKPMLLSNPGLIHIGKNVLIRQGVRMEAILSDARRIPEFRIGSNVNIEQGVHLICHSRLIIGSNVSITAYCAVVDVSHPYLDIHNPVKIGDRILDDDSFVEIGDGSFLGFGSLIMPNVRIGKHCVIGANSVVTKDVPDYAVAAGSPAKITRQYNPEMEKWAVPE